MATNKKGLSTTSKNNEKNEDVIEILDPDIPDRSYGDYYCKLCDSHMNSDSMWEAHVTGKRHIKNVEKGDAESKYENLTNVESSVKQELRNVKDPIVGLSYIHEIRRKEKNVPPYYNCFLCHANVPTASLMIEHILSLKHRLNYIKEIEPEEYNLIEATNLRRGQMEPLVLETVKKLEEKFGKGTVKVKVEKNTKTDWTYSANKSLNVDDTVRKPHKSSRDDSNKYVQKSFSKESSLRRRERSQSPSYSDDRFKSPPRSRSPRDFRERDRRYSDEKYSVDDKRKMYSTKKKISPPRRELSPKYDYNVNYLHSSKKSKLHDRMDISSRYDYKNQQKSEKSTYDLRDHLQSISSRFQQDYRSSHERSVHDFHAETKNLADDKPKSFEAVLKDLSHFSTDECYRLFYEILKTLPVISNVKELMNIIQLIKVAKEKLNCSYVQTYINHILLKNDIPGPDDIKTLNIAPDNSPKASNTANFLSDLFKSANSAIGKVPIPLNNFPYQLPSSYTPAISSQLSSLINNCSSASYQVPSANSYQAPSTSYYSNQAQYEKTHVPFASGSVQSVPQNVASFNQTDIPPSKGHIFNYSHSSTLSKQFQQKF